MDYETFRLRLRDALCQEMGEEVSITLQQVRKNNGVYCQGISIRKKEERIAPVIYLDPYYEAFQAGLEFYKVVREIRRQYLLGNVSDISMEAFGDYQKVKDQIYYKLINYEKIHIDCFFYYSRLYVISLWNLDLFPEKTGSGGSW